MKIKGRESVLYFPSDRDLQGIRTMRCPVDHVTRGIFQIFPRGECVQVTGLKWNSPPSPTVVNSWNISSTRRYVDSRGLFSEMTCSCSRLRPAVGAVFLHEGSRRFIGNVPAYPVFQISKVPFAYILVNVISVTHKWRDGIRRPPSSSRYRRVNGSCVRFSPQGNV